MGVPPAWIEALQEYFPYILVEADGSLGRPLKAHAPHEPVLPPTSSLVVILAGASVLGRPFSEEYVHRPQILAQLTGLEPGGNIRPVSYTHLDVYKRQVREQRALIITSPVSVISRTGVEHPDPPARFLSLL